MLYGIYQNLEELVINATKWKPYSKELGFVCDFYKEDVSSSELEAQVLLLRHLVQKAQETSSHEINVKEIVRVLAGSSTAEKVAFSSVLTAVKLLLVIPATNSTSEHSFPSLRRAKTYLRMTMTQQRLNNLMVFHVHKECTESLYMNIAQEFVAGREGRLQIFGDCRQ